jgi:pilus assembly protein Flp/PilA
MVLVRSGEIMKLATFIQTSVRDDEGVTAIEYALIAALIAIVIVASVTLVGNSLQNIFTYVYGQVQSAI